MIYQPQRPEPRADLPAFCEQCDDARRRQGLLSEVGHPCDICAGTGTDYLGRACRHCESLSTYPENPK